MLRGSFGLAIILGLAASLIVFTGIYLLSPKNNNVDQAVSSPFPVTTPVSSPTKVDLRSIPPASPPPTVKPFTGDSEKIKINLSKNSYDKGETVIIRIFNDSNQDISFFSGPGCAVIFERKIGDNWQQEMVSPYDGSLAPCFQVTIKAKESVSLERKLYDNVLAGTYRVKFQYLNGTIYSREFQIN